MIEEESSKETVSALCESHGVRYNPGESDGCVICRRESTDEESAQGGGRLTWWVLALVALALAATALMDRPGEAEAQSAQDGPLVRADNRFRLRPAHFREEIEAIEKVIYQPRPADLATSGQIGNFSFVLAEEIRRKVSVLAAKPLAMQALIFGKDIESSERRQPVDLRQARRDWEQLRSKLFLEADWMRSSTPDLDHKQAP